LQEVLRRIHDSSEFQEFMNSRGFGVAWGDAGAFAAHMRKSDEAMGRIIAAVGLGG
jgi:hypothetical protein